MTVRLPAWGKRRSKYGNRRVKVAGVSFDSDSEHKRWEELKLLEKAGEIRNLTLHPRFRIVVNNYHICDYVADYGYEHLKPIDLGPKFPDFKHCWFKVVEDRKAGRVTQTDVFKLKKKLMLAVFDVEILITGESN